MHARHACTHARTHARMHARTHARTHAQCRPRAAEAAPHGALRHGHRPGQRSPAGGVPAGCARAAARAASPGVRFKELCPKAASPAGPHVPFWDTAPPPQARGLPNEQQDWALAPGRTVPGAGQRGIVPLRCAIIRRRPKSERGYPSGQRSPFTAIP